MQPTIFHRLFTFSDNSWPKLFVQWLGHLWTASTDKLSQLNCRISDAAHEVFHYFRKREPSNNLADDHNIKPLSLPKNETHSATQLKKEESKEVEIKKEDPLPPLPTSSELPAQTPSKAEEPKKKEEVKPEIEEPPLDDALLDIQNDGVKPKPIPADEPKIAEAVNSNTPQHEHTREKRFRNPLFPKQTELKATPSTSSSPQKSSAEQHVQTSSNKPHQDKIEPIDCGGGGDCQLHCILKGLEMQHPDLAQHEKDNQKIAYTPLDLRIMGVKFARDQIDSCGQHAKTILEYIDADRKEYNDSQIECVEIELQAARAALEKTFKEKKIDTQKYEDQKQAINDKFRKKITDLENNIYISTIEQFLNRLEKKGFYCSTLHLYVLNVLLKVPILVHQAKGVPGHDIQTFNSTNSILNPIHLYRQSNHYKLILI